jgi:sulfatase maturation enzyme AslB (radical SAM superfamily)
MYVGCSAFWKHLCIRPNSVVVPCCLYQDNNEPMILEKDVRETINHSNIVELRAKSLANEKSPGCHKCYAKEASGGASLRMDMNKKYPIDISLASTDSHPDKIETVEFFIGDVCNLKCVMCHPKLSSSWREDFVKLGKKLPKRSEYDPNLELLISKMTSLTYLKFVGGEPLLSEKHIGILKAIEKKTRKRITLEYNTNVTVRPVEELLGYWKDFEKINIRLSIDGHGEVDEFIRFPTKWTQVESNMRYFLALSESYPNINIEILCTVSAYNVGQLDKFYNWIKSFGFSDFIFNPVVEPSFLSPSNLPNDVLEETILKLSNGPEKLKSISNYLKSTQKSFDKEIVSYTKEISKVRNIEVKSYLPHLMFLHNE